MLHMHTLRYQQVSQQQHAVSTSRLARHAAHLQTFPALWAGKNAYSGSVSAPAHETSNLAGEQVGTGQRAMCFAALWNVTSMGWLEEC